jgi:hypothetical protein
MTENFKIKKSLSKYNKEMLEETMDKDREKRMIKIIFFSMAAVILFFEIVIWCF